jgi:hypothetical protein
MSRRFHLAEDGDHTKHNNSQYNFYARENA